MFSIGEKLEFLESDILQRNVINQLPCKLSSDEIVERSQRAVKMRRSLAAKEEAEKSRRAKFKAEYDAKQTEINDLDDSVETGTENRSIPCTMVVVKSVTYIVRGDNNEIAASRSSTPKEAQTVIPGAKIDGNGSMFDDVEVSGDDDIDVDDEATDDDDIEPLNTKAKSKKAKSRG